MRNNDELNPSFKDYLDELTKNNIVLGVALTGSCGRDDNDKYSDIDYVIFVKERTEDIKEGKFFLNDMLFDSRITELRSLMGSHWSRDMFFAYLNCRLLYDKNGEIERILNEKRRQWEKEWIKEISLTLVNMSVIFRFSDNWKGLNADSHYLKFLRRKDYISAHRVLNLGYELILDSLYLLNNKAIPDFKNKIKLLYGLDWMLKENEPFLKEAVLVLENSEQDCVRRYQIMMKIIESIKNYADKNIVLADDLYKYYLNNRKYES